MADQGIWCRRPLLNYRLLGSWECCRLWGRTPSTSVLADREDVYLVATYHYLQPSRVLPSWQFYGPRTAGEQSAPWLFNSLNQPELVLAGGPVETWYIQQREPTSHDVDSVCHQTLTSLPRWLVRGTPQAIIYTVPSENIQTPWIVTHFVRLQPCSKIYYFPY